MLCGQHLCFDLLDHWRKRYVIAASGLIFGLDNRYCNLIYITLTFCILLGWIKFSFLLICAGFFHFPDPWYSVFAAKFIFIFFLQLIFQTVSNSSYWSLPFVPSTERLSFARIFFTRMAWRMNNVWLFRTICSITRTTFTSSLFPLEIILFRITLTRIFDIKSSF